MEFIKRLFGFATTQNSAVNKLDQIYNNYWNKYRSGTISLIELYDESRKEIIQTKNYNSEYYDSIIKKFQNAVKEEEKMHKQWKKERKEREEADNKVFAKMEKDLGISFKDTFSEIEQFVSRVNPKIQQKIFKFKNGNEIEVRYMVDNSDKNNPKPYNIELIDPKIMQSLDGVSKKEYKDDYDSFIKGFKSHPVIGGFKNHPLIIRANKEFKLNKEKSKYVVSEDLNSEISFNDRFSLQSQQ